MQLEAFSLDEAFTNYKHVSDFFLMGQETF